jgi:hypothetical protein
LVARTPFRRTEGGHFHFVDEGNMKFVEELNQLITKHLGPKANLFDYSYQRP